MNMEFTPACTLGATPACAPGATPARTLGTTPAGGQINADWEDLPLGIVGLREIFLAAERSSGPAQVECSFVMFRCGTVAQVRPSDLEFSGRPERGFPEHRPEDASTVSEILVDNARVWEAQRAFPEPAGKVVRQAYGALAAQGYPYPGGPDSNRTAAATGFETEREGELVLVFWPNLDPAQRVCNLAFARPGTDVGSAVAAAGTLRRYDYMFPEVAAVVMPDGTLWAYRTADGGLWTRRPADGRVLQFGPGARPAPGQDPTAAGPTA